MRSFARPLPNATTGSWFWFGNQGLSYIQIPILYVFEMIPLTGIEKSFTTADFRRQWVARLWGEQSFEFFAASMSV
jgi:hypothetical protein